jgi:hypothetical protein
MRNAENTSDIRSLTTAELDEVRGAAKDPGLGAPYLPFVPLVILGAIFSEKGWWENLG